MNFRQASSLAVIAGLISVLGSTHVYAANLLKLQGTEPPGGDATPKLFGLAQMFYMVDKSDANSSGNYVPPKLVPPDYSSQQGFNIYRAWLGVRGRNVANDDKINYFLLTEFGNNAITAVPGRTVSLTDASVTFNHIPHARVRAGLFKTPGAEEGMTGVDGADFVEFTNVTNQLLLERVPNATASTNISPTNPERTGVSLNGFTKPVAAFRDVGVEVFDSIAMDSWELSYAGMFGNGNGLNASDNDSNKDLYGYVAVEKIFSGEGAARQGMKFFGWGQNGKRTYDGDADGVNDEYSRNRNGIGMTYRKAAWHGGAEYIQARGMIFLGPDKPSFDYNTFAAAGGDGLHGKGDGWYAAAGYRFLPTGWELDGRYEVLTVLKDDTLETEFKAYSLGAQYYFNPRTRVTFNATSRDFKVLNTTAGSAINANLNGVGMRYVLQLTTMF